MSVALAVGLGLGGQASAAGPTTVLSNSAAGTASGQVVPHFAPPTQVTDRTGFNGVDFEYGASSSASVRFDRLPPSATRTADIATSASSDVLERVGATGTGKISVGIDKSVGLNGFGDSAETSAAATGLFSDNFRILGGASDLGREVTLHKTLTLQSGAAFIYSEDGTINIFDPPETFAGVVAIENLARFSVTGNAIGTFSGSLSSGVNGGETTVFGLDGEVGSYPLFAAGNPVFLPVHSIARTIDLTLHARVGDLTAISLGLSINGESSISNIAGGRSGSLFSFEGAHLTWDEAGFITDDQTGEVLHGFSAISGDTAFNYVGIDAGVDPSQGVPEPSTWALAICGFGLAGAALRRRRTCATTDWADMTTVS
jgi:hypothetical protein